MSPPELFLGNVGASAPTSSSIVQFTHLPSEVWAQRDPTQPGPQGASLMSGWHGSAGRSEHLPEYTVLEVNFDTAEGMVSPNTFRELQSAPRGSSRRAAAGVARLPVRSQQAVGRKPRS